MRLVPMPRSCEHCGAPYNPNHEHQRYCSVKCSANAKAMRQYYRRKRDNSEVFQRVAERRRLYAKRWREENRAQGNCPRCGDPNDGAEIGVSICSSCYTSLKGG